MKAVVIPSTKIKYGGSIRKPHVPFEVNADEAINLERYFGCIIVCKKACEEETKRASPLSSDSNSSQENTQAAKRRGRKRKEP